jgi:hypothetical protein
MQIRVLNEIGILEFENQIAEIRQQRRDSIDPLLLTDNTFSGDFEKEIHIDLINFNTKKEISRYLSEKIDLKNNKHLYYNIYLWSWLSVAYFDLVCPRPGTKPRKVNETAKYILREPKNWRRYYRHLLACPARLYCELGDLSDAFLSSPIHIWGDFHEQLTAYQSIATNRPLIETASKLYWDSSTQKLKKGSGSKGAGTPRRFSDLVGQLELTFDLNAMLSDDLYGLLPQSEFNRWAALQKSI